ncbi:prolyl oligopeptidase family serine peptidase [Alkalimonas collagenimarina]|uniref:Prolyl oligopeptidase family serine peptidase n=1 Tax=Alkalimonas collagenimarina TaxID=400390 RepID=A0ABT9GUT3_9GAMM|nr:prolyl oligopeptidase family serine peptidase [Alkalimonas collagenimarina]MDP4534639.1 prolyl oligopeptidase family serine peptidase [Alkalimonas collagenimarina]
MTLTQLVSGSLLLVCLVAQSAPDRAVIERSLDLRENWLPLTRNLMLEPVWTRTGDAFHYKLSVEGGFLFFRDQVYQSQTEPAFDHQLVATGLSRVTGQDYTALNLPFDRFQYADDGQSIRFYLHNIHWQCQLQVANCQDVTEQRQPSAFGVVRDLQQQAASGPVPSPDGNYQAQVSGHNLLVLDQQGRLVFQTEDGVSSNFYDPQLIRWAPDSSALALVRVQPGKARYVTRVLSAPADQLEPQVIQQLYPKPGDAVDVDQPVLVRPADKTAIDIPTTLFPSPYRIDSLAWQQGDQGVVWLSERDGWSHLYWVDSAGQQLQQLTQGNWRVRQVLAVDESSGTIWFTASGYYPGQDPYYEHLFRVGLDGSDFTTLTEGNAHHEVTLSPDYQHFILRYSRVDLPYVAELRQSHDGSLVRELARADISQLSAAGFRPPQPFVAKGRDGETDIWGLIVKPQNFDPDQAYPVIENIYAGPHDSFVPKSFWPFGFHSGGDKVIGMQAMADLGFIVVQIDGMGTANRSKAFHDVAWQDLVDSGFPDRILWHQAAAKQFPWYNIEDGMGIYGASAGGQSTVAALLFHPEFYKVGVAYAGCYDNRMDKISWNEQWLGYPIGSQYAASSVVEQAHLLQGQLLIINGEQDSNVDPASTMQLVDALIRADKDFDLLIVPGGEHSVGRSSGPIRYVQRRQFDFFLRHLKQQDTPDWNRVQ